MSSPVAKGNFRRWSDGVCHASWLRVYSIFYLRQTLIPVSKSFAEEPQLIERTIDDSFGDEVDMLSLADWYDW
jgi:hypothetical protein